MTSDEALVSVLRALGDADVPYMLVGSFSSNFYGVSRSTRDADFVVVLDEQAYRRLRDKLPPSMEFDPQMSFETVTGTSRHIIRLPGRQFKIELFMLSDDPHDQERFRRRKKERMLDMDVYLPTPEDVVITKVRWASHARRFKDMDDVQKVLIARGRSLDWAYIHRWCTEHGTLERLEEIRKSIADV